MQSGNTDRWSNKHSRQSRWLRLVIVCVFFSSSFSRIASSLHLRLFIAADSVLFYYKELCNWWNVIFVKFNCVGLPYGGVCIPPMCVAMAALFYLCKRRGLHVCRRNLLDIQMYPVEHNQLWMLTHAERMVKDGVPTLWCPFVKQDKVLNVHICLTPLQQHSACDVTGCGHTEAPCTIFYRPPSEKKPSTESQ